MRITHPIRSLFQPPYRSTRASLSTFLTLTSNSRNYHLYPPLSSMADTGSISAVSVEDDSKYGFKRDEMYSSNLANTVGSYDRHVFLSYKNPDAWTARGEENDLPNLLASALKSRKDDISVKMKLTVSGGGESDGDVLIFPEMIGYKSLNDTNVDSFVDDVLVNGKPWGLGEQEGLTASYIFVCAHGNRDKRCGVCGPVLIEKLKEEIVSRGLKDEVFVLPCSHIGGHKYAGNLIVFSRGLDGKVMGHWYGYVTPADVPELLDQHLAKGEIIERLWRGQMGAPPTEGAENLDKKKLSNGTDMKKKDKKHKEKKHKEINSLEKKEVSGGCCQGVDGVSCCKSGNLEESEVKGQNGFSRWIQSLEQTDVLATAAVVGAVATVAVAYSFYRRSA